MFVKPVCPAATKSTIAILCPGSNNQGYNIFALSVCLFVCYQLCYNV